MDCLSPCLGLNPVESWPSRTDSNPSPGWILRAGGISCGRAVLEAILRTTATATAGRVRDLPQPLYNHIGRDLQIAGLRTQELLGLYDLGKRFGGIRPRAIRDLKRLLLLKHMRGFQKLLESCFIQRRFFPFAYNRLLQVVTCSRLVRLRHRLVQFAVHSAVPQPRNPLILAVAIGLDYT